MININGNCYVDVELEGLEKLTFLMFEKLLVKEFSGLGIPVFELRLVQNNFSLLPFLRKANVPITITYGANVESARKYTFIIYNYNYIDNQMDEKFTLVLTGMLDVKDFTNTPRIRSIKGSSDKVISSITSLTPRINYQGADDQVWIQHNNSDKNFVERVLSHSYCGDGNFITGAITVDNELIITSIKDKFSEEPSVTISQDSSNISFDSLKVESDSAIWSSFLSEGRQLPVLNVHDRSLDLYSSSMDSIIDGESNSSFSSNINYPTILNSGNCHEEYYQSWLNNLNYSVQFNRNNIFIFTSINYLSNDVVKLHDLVKFIPNDKYKNELVDPMSGAYILSEKVTVITQKGFSHRFRLNRDYVL